MNNNVGNMIEMRIDEYMTNRPEGQPYFNGCKVMSITIPAYGAGTYILRLSYQTIGGLVPFIQYDVEVYRTAVLQLASVDNKEG